MTALCRGIFSVRRSKRVLLQLLLCALIMLLLLQGLSRLVHSRGQSLHLNGLHLDESQHQLGPAWDWTRDLPCPADDVMSAPGPVCARPILTMLTSMNENDVTRARVHNNTIVNWRALGPCVRPLLFVNDTGSEVAAFSKGLGWGVEPLKHSMHGVPILKFIFLSGINLSSTPLYLYANADVLFDSSLIKTASSLLCSIKSHVGQRKSDDVSLTSSHDHVKLASSPLDSVDGIFAVGRRLNVDAKKVTSPLPEDVKRLRPLGCLFITDAQDYFITTSSAGLGLAPLETRRVERDSGAQKRENGSHPLEAESNDTTNTGHFPWEMIPNFIIGRPGYDNWLVAQVATRRYKVPWAVDVTDTVLAVHQTGDDGNFSGWTSPAHKDTVRFNHKLAGLSYNYGPGRTTSLPWMSTVGIGGRVAFVKRSV